MILSGLSEEILDALERIEEDTNPDEGTDKFSEEQELRLSEMLSEGARQSFDPNDNIGSACEYLRRIRNGEYVDFFAPFESEN